LPRENCGSDLISPPLVVKKKRAEEQLAVGLNLQTADQKTDLPFPIFNLLKRRFTYGDYKCCFTGIK